jgi:rhodanese-related sulfurtransferase
MKEHLEILKKELENNQAVLMDVREQDEWDQGHLQQAILVPLSELASGIEPEGIAKNRKIYLHCRSGVRVFSAEPALQGMGFQQVIPLKEGFSELANYGFEVEDED